MNIKKAAEATRALCQPQRPIRDPDGDQMCHAVWMLDGIIKGYIQYEKAHRWLGFAQGIIVMRGIATVDDMKFANKGLEL